MATPEFATLTPDDLVTGEAVALDLPPAGLGVRMVSGLIDVGATILLLVAVVIVFAVASLGTDQALAETSVLVATALVFIAYPTTCETLSRGRSLGKLAMGLRAVRDDAGPISFQHALTRALLGFVEIYLFFGAPAFFTMLVNARGKRLGDLASGTYVVRERVRLALPPPPTMPPHLATWAAGADITSLPTGLALGVRQYLSRFTTLDPRARATVGARLAGQVSPHVAPPPPPDTRPEDFLSAVIASRRERDLVRLRREADLRHRLTARR